MLLLQTDKSSSQVFMFGTLTHRESAKLADEMPTADGLVHTETQHRKQPYFVGGNGLNADCKS